MRKRMISTILIVMMLFTMTGFASFGQINESDINYFLEKIANTKDDAKRELGIELLNTYVNTDNPNIAKLKAIIKIGASEADIKKLESLGYTLDQALDALDILGQMDRTDIQKLVQAVENQNINEMKQIVNKYAKDEQKSEDSDNSKNSGSSGGGGGGGSSKPADKKEEPITDNKDLEQTPTEQSKDSSVESIAFKDVEGHWAKEYILFLNKAGIIKGQSENKFNPNGQITRAEFATLIVKLFDLKEKDSNETIDFEDVKPQDWFYDIVKIAKQHGIVQGISSKQFAPQTFVTREQMVTMIVNAFDTMGFEGEQSQTIGIGKFDDKNSIAKWAMAPVEKAVNLGIIRGRQENLFVPQGISTRAEASVVIKHVYDLIKK